jgi:hypothetical protein
MQEFPISLESPEGKRPIYGRDFARRLRRLRRHAKKRGFRVTRVFGDFSVITVQTEPPRAICGLRGVDLETIETALRLPPGESASRRTPPDEATIRKFIDIASVEAVFAVIDQMTRPQFAAAAE